MSELKTIKVSHVSEGRVQYTEIMFDSTSKYNAHLHRLAQSLHTTRRLGKFQVTYRDIEVGEYVNQIIVVQGIFLNEEQVSEIVSEYKSIIEDASWLVRQHREILRYFKNTKDSILYPA